VRRHVQLFPDRFTTFHGPAPGGPGSRDYPLGPGVTVEGVWSQSCCSPDADAPSTCACAVRALTRTAPAAPRRA
jgi:hypothetical protein